MSDLLGYKEHLDKRWDYYHGPTSLDRQMAEEEALRSAALPEPKEGTQSAQAPEGSTESTSHIPGPLEGLAWVGENLAAPLRMLITKHATGQDPVGTGKDGEFTGEDFSKSLGLKGEGTPLWKNVLGVGAEVLTDPTSALPIGGKVTQKAVTAAKDALTKTGEVSKVIEDLQGVPRAGAPESTDVFTEQSPVQYIEDYFKKNPSSAKKQEILRESVGVPTSALSQHARALYLQKAGRDIAVIDDSVAKGFGYAIDDSALAQKKYTYLQDTISKEASNAGVAAKDYQKVFGAASDAIEKFNLAPQLEKLLAMPEAAEFAATAQEAAKVVGNEAGFARIGAALLLTRMMVGAGVGATVADEDKLTGALVGAGLSLTPEAATGLAKLAKKVAPEVAQKMRTPPPPAWSPEYKRERFAEAVKTLKAKAAAEVKRPLSQVEQEASALVQYQEVSTETLKHINPNAVMTDVEVRATQLVLKESADHLRDMATRMDVSNPAEMQEFMKQLFLHGEADFGRNYTESGLGRALGVIDATKADQAYLDQMTKVVKDAMSGVDPNRIVELVRNTNSYDHMLKFASSMKKPGFKDMFIEYWVNGLLSGPATYALNMGGSALFHGLNMFEKGMSALYGNPSAPAEALAMFEGTIAGLTNAFKLSWEVAKTETKASLKGQATERITPAITGQNVASLTRMVDPAKLSTTKYGPISTAVDYLGWAAEHGTNVVGTLARHPRIAMVSQDEFTRGIASSSEIYRQATLNAAADVERANLTGKAARTLYAERKKFWIDNPSPSAVRAGKDYGAYLTFMKELGPTGKSLQALTSSSILAKTALPVLSAPINVAKAGFLERTPLGVFTKNFQSDLAAGGERKQMALTRMSMGSSIIALATTWAANGIITGPGPDSPEVKKAMRGEGVMPFSLNLTALMNGGPTNPQDSRPQPGDQLIDLNRLDPAIMPAISVGVLLTQYAGQLSEEDYSGAAAELSIALGEKIADKSFMTGVARFTSVLADPHRNLNTFLKSYPSSLLPASSLMNAVTKEVDPVRRDPQDLAQVFLAKIPFLSTKVIPDRNRYGEEVHYTPGLGPDIASPVYSDTVKDTRLINAFQEDEVHFTKLPNTIGNVVLPPKLYDELRVIMGQEVVNSKGQTLKEAELAILKEAERDKHTTGPKSWRAAQLMKLDHEFRDKARLILLRRNPEYAQAVLDDDRERLKKLDSGAESALLGNVMGADMEGVDVKRGKSKSANIPFKVR